MIFCYERQTRGFCTKQLVQIEDSRGFNFYKIFLLIEINNHRKAKTFHRKLSSKIKVTLYNYWSLSSNLKNKNANKIKQIWNSILCSVYDCSVQIKLIMFVSNQRSWLSSCRLSSGTVYNVEALDVWNTANSGSSERYLWPRYQTELTCYNKLREALSDYV